MNHVGLKGSNTGYLTRAICILHVNTLTIISEFSLKYSKRDAHYKFTVRFSSDAILLDGQPNIRGLMMQHAYVHGRCCENFTASNNLGIRALVYVILLPLDGNG